jgi:galactosylceramidase
MMNVAMSLVAAGIRGAAHTNIVPTEPSFQFDGIGGLSGGGATSTFLLAYEQEARDAMLDWMFKPDFAGSLDILKVEIGADDQTTDGCESCHMRSPTEVNCSRGYEWPLMREAVKRNPSITLYGLPWGFPGWLGFGTQNPYHNVTATADYTVKWVECGRDIHGLNIR